MLNDRWSMDKAFEDIQREFYTSAEEKRFFWQTQNPYVYTKECELLEFIRSKIKPQDRILEVGCGEGANIKNLISMGVNATFTGVDFLPEKVTFCANLNLPDTEFETADARNLPFEDQSYDLVFARDLLHHVNEDRDTVIKELLRVTKPDGVVVVIEGNVQKFTNWVFATIYNHEKGMKDSTQKKLLSLLETYQSTLIAAESTNFFRFVLHYNLGIPALASNKVVVALLRLQERLFKVLLPKKRWAYWLISIEKVS